MPEDRPAADFDHRLRPKVGLLGQARAQASGEDYGAHDEDRRAFTLSGRTMSLDQQSDDTSRHRERITRNRHLKARRALRGWFGRRDNRKQRRAASLKQGPS
jgi:hypothetical protein